jgi:hypothetical protein
MSAMVRRAGRATLADGTQVAWSVADGRRGRRWRAVTTRDGALISAVLLEVAADGRPARLELTTAAGLLTLHPESSGSLHGNTVTARGVHHLTFAWSAEHELEIAGLPITSAVAARRLADSTAAGRTRTVPVVAVAADLAVAEGVRRFVRLGEASWRIEGDGDPRPLTIDERGLPVWLAEAEEWPLELDSDG